MMEIKELEKSIEQSWLAVRKDFFIGHLIWWNEQEVVSSFYHHLRPKINEVNKKLKDKIQIIPQYTPIIPSRATKPKTKEPVVIYPTPKRKGSSEKIDIGLVLINSNDFKYKLSLAYSKEHEKVNSIWEVKHEPLILMEFKNEYESDSGDSVKEDLEKLNKLKKIYNISRCYVCFVEYEKFLPSPKDYNKIKKMLGKNAKFFRILQGCWDKKEKWVKESMI